MFGIILCIFIVSLISIGLLIYTQIPSQNGYSTTVSTTTSTTSPRTSPTITPENFHWGIKVGDSFTYNVSYQYYPDGPFGEPDINYTHTITVEIINLPGLSNIDDESSFKNDLLNAIKVNCTYQNGTAIDFFIHRIYSRVLSFGFLPIGDWEWIDTVFPSQINEESTWTSTKVGTPSVIATNRSDNSLWILRNELIGYDELDSIWANVSLSNGVPIYINYSDKMYSGGGYTYIDFKLIHSDMNTTGVI